MGCFIEPTRLEEKDGYVISIGVNIELQLGILKCDVIILYYINTTK